MRELQVRRIWFGDAKAKPGLQKPLPLKLENPINIIGFSVGQCVNMKWRSEIIFSRKSLKLTELDSENDIIWSAGLAPEKPVATMFFPTNHYIQAKKLFIHFFNLKRGDCGWSVFIYYLKSKKGKGS